MWRITCYKIVIVFYIFAISGVATIHAIAQNDTQTQQNNTDDVKRITGTVAKVSFVFSTIMLACDLGYITFNVPYDTLIMRGANKIKIEEIKPEETISIQYIQPSPSEYVAVYIRASEEHRD